MISVVNHRFINGHKKILELVSLSTDEKPTDRINFDKIHNGSTLYEMDTKKAYIFDESSRKWWEV